MMDAQTHATVEQRRARLVDARGARDVVDALATEEPLELRLQSGSDVRSLAITMRTPGNDFELATGFLLSEGVVGTRDDIVSMSYCTSETNARQTYNVVTVSLAAPALEDIARLERHFAVTSACGVCGKTAADDLHLRADPVRTGARIPVALLTSLPQKMRASQKIFAATGGLHAAALFDERGELLAVREDVGRHNALDKAIGWAMMNGRRLDRCIACVSGRASYELVQKCIVARIPILCAVSAPSTLAVSLAERFDVTLAGFVREDRATLYATPGRIMVDRSAPIAETSATPR